MIIKRQLTEWAFKQEHDTRWRQATVPGTIHTDLIDHQLIHDPFYGEEEKHVQWVDKVNWVYQTTLDVDKDLLGNDHIKLVFHGLDTYTDIAINGQSVYKTENMFRRYTMDVKKYLHQGENTLQVTFESPINRDIMKPLTTGVNYPADNDDSQLGGVGQHKLSVFARKAPYHYGWDWGPRFVTSGIWKPVELVAYSAAKIEDVYVNQKEVSEEYAQLLISIEIEASRSMSVDCLLQYGDIRKHITCDLQKGTNHLEVPVNLTHPRLWWSRGLGEAYRYNVQVSVSRNKQVIDTTTFKHGIRKVALVRDHDEHGQTFYLKLNDVPVFCKGANHIPNDSFIPRVTKERYEHEINSAVEANMNMLRVWGGGIYEQDIFYELCDEKGLLVWQDFMFACSMYPGDPSFLENVRQEAIDQTKRLRRYASVVLWCGNNEIDVAWAEFEENAGWGWKQKYSDTVRKQLWLDYKNLFHGVLAEVTSNVVPNEPYWPSSPLADLTHDKEQHALGVKTSGDVHYWDVWHGKQPFEAYNENVGRFMSEYGFQSFPSIETIKTFAEPSAYDISSDVMSHHQKNGAGNQLIKTYMDKYLPEPKDFESFLYMSQVLQAEGIQHAIEAHRRNKPYCMGTLYWQMNDCWPVASWSSIDYFGRWKALHYQVKESFKDVLVSIEEKNEQLNIFIVSDVLTSQSLTLSVSLLDLAGQVMKHHQSEVDVAKNMSQCVQTINLSELLGDMPRDTVVLKVELGNKENVVDVKKHYFVSTKQLSLEPADISVQRDETNHCFNISTTAFAKSIELKSEEAGYFSMNYFDLLPGETVNVQFFKRNQLTPELPEVTIRSLIDTI